VAAPNAEGRGHRGWALLQIITASVACTSLIDVEVAQVLRQQVAKGAMSDARGQEALQDFLDLALPRYPHDFLLPRVWDLRKNLTAYDAFYVALAEALGFPPVTCDANIAGAPGHSAQVDVV
jgi:predicted nucleic acid-binding protein